jgi:hypothetical protein
LKAMKKAPPASVFHLAGALDHAITEYEKRHPDTTRKQVAGALRMMLEAVEGESA